MRPTLPLLLLLSTAPLAAQQPPEWAATTPIGTALSAGFGGAVVDPLGTSYVTASSGASSMTDILTIARRPDGTELWRSTFTGTGRFGSQARDIALDLGRSTVWVAGSTPGPNNVGNVLLLGYHTLTGALLRTVQVPSTYAESGGSLTVDPAGNIYVAGGTVGDGSDVLLLKIDSQGQLSWRRTWDGAAWGPYSQDIEQGVKLDRAGNVLVLVHGVTAALQPDYVVLKYSPAGSLLWTGSWGGNGGDYPRDFAVDGNGDVFVTGSGLNVNEQISTVRLRSADGAVVWQAFDAAGLRNYAVALDLDAAGGVYILGSVDPDGDRSNRNDDIYLIKRSAATGSLVWTWRFGGPRKGESDGASDVLVDGGRVHVGAASSTPPYSGQVITFVLDAGAGTVQETRPLPETLRPGVGTGNLAIDAQSCLYNFGQSRHPNTGVTTLSTFKYTQPQGYRLDASDLLGNTTATLDVRNATPLTVQFIAGSIAGAGPTPMPPLGITMGIRAPILLAFGLADASGDYGLRVPIPPITVPGDVWLQAVTVGRGTPVVARRLQ